MVDICTKGSVSRGLSCGLAQVDPKIPHRHPQPCEWGTAYPACKLGEVTGHAGAQPALKQGIHNMDRWGPTEAATHTWVGQGPLCSRAAIDKGTGPQVPLSCPDAQGEHLLGVRSESPGGGEHRLFSAFVLQQKIKTPSAKT